MQGFERPITVTRPNLPSLAAYAAGLEAIWDTAFLTNNGPLSRKLERSLQRLLGAPELVLFNNGALALTAMLQAMRLQGEVVTTPFTFVATANSIAQCGLTPVFADVEPQWLTLDPEAVEAAIGPRTSAILAVHVFGNVCRHAELAAIAARHGIALIYDAAHAFGVTWAGQKVATLGDASMFSLHATKMFHTVEGGALTFHDASLGPALAALRNHGLEEDGDVVLAGLNGKMSELHALMGLLMLDQVEAAIAQGAAIEAVYRARLAEVPGIRPLDPAPAEVRPNHSFIPVLLDAERFGLDADALKAALLRYNVHVRRYFTPLVSDMTAFRGAAGRDTVPCARAVGPAVLALPTYTGLALDDVHRICDLIAHVQRGVPVRARSGPVAVA